MTHVFRAINLGLISALAPSGLERIIFDFYGGNASFRYPQTVKFQFAAGSCLASIEMESVDGKYDEYGLLCIDECIGDEFSHDREKFEVSFQKYPLISIISVNERENDVEIDAGLCVDGKGRDGSFLIASGGWPQSFTIMGSRGLYFGSDLDCNMKDMRFRSI